MIEKVARAICKASINATQEAEDGLWESVYAPIAKAAIEAMREATPEMFTAGFEDAPHCDLGNAWVSMIDAALEEPKTAKDTPGASSTAYDDQFSSSPQSQDSSQE